MTYHGATAKDVERAILIPIEQAMEGLPGLSEEIDADGYRGRARMRLEAKAGVDLEYVQGRRSGARRCNFHVPGRDGAT